MSRHEALTELIAKVEAGTAVGHYAPPFDVFAHLDSVYCARLCYRADQKGSLDAALALQEAVLPGWEWYVEGDGHAEVWKPIPEAYSFGIDSTTPARAWLLAILYALREEAER